MEDQWRNTSLYNYSDVASTSFPDISSARQRSVEYIPSVIWKGDLKDYMSWHDPRHNFHHRSDIPSLFLSSGKDVKDYMSCHEPGHVTMSNGRFFHQRLNIPSVLWGSVLDFPSVIRKDDMIPCHVPGQSQCWMVVFQQRCIDTLEKSGLTLIIRLRSSAWLSICRNNTH